MQDFLKERNQASGSRLFSFIRERHLSPSMDDWPPGVEEEYNIQARAEEAEWQRKGSELSKILEPLRGLPRIIPVVDGYDEGGRPLDRKPLLPKARQPMLDYLESAPIIWSEPGFDKDEFIPGEFDVPRNYRTDGTFIWSGAVPHYLGKHNFRPHRWLVRHVFENDFPTIDVDNERLRRAEAVITGVPASDILRLARVYDGRDAEGQPIFDRLMPISDTFRTTLLDYLESAPIVLAARGFDEDELTPGTHDVPLTFHTDGRWIWSGAVAHYLRKHGIPPEEDLAHHIVHNEYRLPEISDADKQRAVAVITGP
ncbi:hypothetical protein [Nocardia caishijiensis]|uniref:Uncharacterized protein n=1 Tax=Nocardia caishijiensis TaxID=184756 RepID=A0ABQ6YR79_9NOCA|nr:hypothetical protein [Nocardia caishijiensis]KAF0848295.1 hypothetical protein FNL39_102443 [Nocardia caishijiensis]